MKRRGKSLKSLIKSNNYIITVLTVFQFTEVRLIK